jgi:hypothetical protein
MLDASILENKDELAPYARRLVEGLGPLLGRFDETKLSAKSSVEIRQERRGWMLELRIDAADPDIPFLNLIASNGQCILGYADSEQIECHSDPDADQDLIPMVLDAIAAYLNGITIVEHYNKNDRLVKKEYLFGIEGEAPSKRRFGVGPYPLIFPKQITSSKTRTYRFFR